MKDHDVHSLSHTKWECKYHIVFAPKYRRKVFYGQKRYEIGQILRELCRWKQVNLLEAEACPDHIHILVEVPPKISVSNFMGFLKGKSSLMIYEKWGNMKYKYRNRSFWCRGYYVSTVGKNEKKITQTSHMKNMSFPHNHTALSNKHYQAADFCSALRIYSGSLLTKSCAITCSCLSVAWNTVLILASITSCKIIMDCWNVTSAISFTIR